VSLLEAMSAGLPAVATPVGGIPEVLADGASGMLVAPGDKAGLERSLRKILGDRPFAARLGAAARESARARFAPERVLPALEQLYESLGVSSAGGVHQPAVALRKAA
jgi:glycosyltransferase involved in cell wall biosynthesis